MVGRPRRLCRIPPSIKAKAASHASIPKCGKGPPRQLAHLNEACSMWMPFLEFLVAATSCDLWGPEIVTPPENGAAAEKRPPPTPGPAHPEAHSRLSLPPAQQFTFPAHPSGDALIRIGSRELGATRTRKRASQTSFALCSAWEGRGKTRQPRIV